MPDVPPNRADRRLLLVTGSFLLVAAVFFGGVLWLATQRDNTRAARSSSGSSGH